MPEPQVLLITSDPSSMELAVDAVDDLQHRVRIIGPDLDVIDLLLGDGTPGREPELSPPKAVVLAMDSKDRLVLEILRLVRSSHRAPNLPLVVWTPPCTPDAVAEEYLAGATSVVFKPAEPNDEALQLAHTLNYWMNVNEPPLELTSSG